MVCGWNGGGMRTADAAMHAKARVPWTFLASTVMLMVAARPSYRAQVPSSAAVAPPPPPVVVDVIARIAAWTPPEGVAVVCRQQTELSIHYVGDGSIHIVPSRP